MPKFLNVLNMNENEIQNFVVHNTSSGIAKAGALILDGTLLKYHNGTGYITLGDNDIATTSDAGVSKLRYSVGSTPAANAQSVTASRTYGVTANSSDQLVVNVPWTDSSALTEDQVEDFAAGMITSATHAGLTTTYDDTAGTLTFSVDGVLEDLDTLGAAGSDGQIIVATGAGVFQYESGSTLRSTINVDVAGTDNSTAVTLATVTSNYLSLTGQEITAGTVPVALGGTGATDASTARTNLDVDQSGTDNSTPVTLVTTSHDYLTLSTQAITLNAIDLTTDVTGDLPIAEGGTGQSTASAAANALLNTSQGGALTIGDSSDVITIGGDLVVTGSQTTTLSNTVKTGDNFIELATGNTTGNSIDFGWYGKFFDTALGYAGMHWDASSTRFKLGYGGTVPPSSTHDWDTAGHLEVGKLTTTDLVIGGHTISDVDITSEDSNADDHLMTSAAIRAAIADNNPGFLTAHPSISQATTNLTNTGRTYIQSLGLDSNGHVTSIATATETVSDTVDMGDGFAVSADTNTVATTITENDTLTIAGGTAINTVSNPDGTITINNEINNTDQLTNGANFITASANITGTSAGITAGNVGAVKVVELTHGANGVTGTTNNTTDSTTWTITHGMGASYFYKVEVVQDSGNYDTVYVDVTRPTNATIKIDFGAAVANGAYVVMIQRMA